jgi:hypothetical protein
MNGQTAVQATRQLVNPSSELYNPDIVKPLPLSYQPKAVSARVDDILKRHDACEFNKAANGTTMTKEKIKKGAEAAAES